MATLAVLALHLGAHGTTLVTGTSRFPSEIGSPSYQQETTYQPYDGSPLTKETLWAASLEDLSASQPSSEYDAKCSHCYHGYGHTQELHKKNVGL